MIKIQWSCINLAVNVVEFARINMFKFILLFLSSALWVDAAQVSFPSLLFHPKKWAANSELTGTPDFFDGALIVQVDVSLAGQTSDKPFKLTLDSMSEDIWIAGDKCKSTFCNGKNKLPAGNDGVDTTVSHNLVKGLKSAYVINVNKLPSTSFPVVAATSVSSSLSDKLNEAADGVIGLKSEYFKKVLKPEGILSIKTTGKGSGLYKGIPTDLIVGNDNQRHRSIKSRSSSQWKIDINYVSNSNGEWYTWCTLGCAAVLDTTFSGISGPPSEIDSLNSFIGADENGEIDCERVPYLEPIVLHIGQSSYKIDPKNYFMEPEDIFSSKCRSAFVVERTYNNLWRIGLPMFKQYLTVFDFNDNSVSFLALKENITPRY